MDEANSVRVPVTCECGHKFEVPIAGKDLETLEFTCPGCGTVDRFNADQVASIMASYERAKAGAVEGFRKDVNDMLVRATKGKKGITYRPKR